MKKLTDNQWRWVGVIVLIILPSLLVRVTNVESMRIFGMIISLGLFPACLFFGSIFLPKEKFLLHSEAFKKKHGQKVLNRTILTVRLAGILSGIFIAIWVTFPAYFGLFNYLILDRPLLSVEGKIRDINTGLIDPLGLINQTVGFDNEKDKSYSIWYPSTRMHMGKNYHLELLPNTNIIIHIEKIGN